MRQVLICLLLNIPCSLLAAPGARESAFNALTALPINEIPRVAKVAGCEGTPFPERWHFLVYAPEAENGYREYVVANHQVVVRRELSQFAESLRADDVMGVDGVKVDSDRLVALAQQYAKVNHARLDTFNFELSREGPGLAPRWKVDCFDQEGSAVGSILVNATQERVVAHEGFKREPQESDLREARTTRFRSAALVRQPWRRVRPPVRSRRIPSWTQSANRRSNP
jgi:hypothetical protein